MKRIWMKLAVLFIFGALCFGSMRDYALAAGEDTVTEETETEADDSAVEQRLSTPVLKKATAAADGAVKVSWKAVKGADGYMVYRKAADGNWKRLGTTTSTSYKDNSSLKNEKTYYYSVRAYRGSESVALENKYSSAYWSLRDTSGLKIVYTQTPTLKKAINTAGGIKVSWNKVSGARGYVVLRKSSGGSWEQIGTTRSSSFTDKTVSNGKSYRYTVRAYRGSKTKALENTYSARYWSGYNTSVLKAVRMKTPVLKSKVTATSKGIKLSWKAVSGAKGYAVLRKTESGKWKRIGTTTSTSYTDTASLKNGETYYYTVRAYRGSKTKALENTYSAVYWSYYDTEGVSIVYTKAPAIKSANKTSSGVDVSWQAVDGVKGYAVYRKASGGSWTQLATTTSTSYTDKTTVSGKTYYYAVRAYRGSRSKALANLRNANYWSSYNSVKAATVANDAMYEKAQSYSSSTNWLILTNCSTNKIGIFYGSKGSWEMKYYWDCTTGKSSTPTKKGVFTVGSRGSSFSGSNYTCWYYTQWSGNYLFHSILYQRGSSTAVYDGRLGQNLSHGCVRLSMDHAKWIYNNIPSGTTVVTY